MDPRLNSQRSLCRNSRIPVMKNPYRSSGASPDGITEGLPEGNPQKISIESTLYFCIPGKILEGITIGLIPVEITEKNLESV